MPLNRRPVQAMAVAVGAMLCLLPQQARADLVLSQLIVELNPARTAVADIDVWNDSPDRAYVAAEPREILSPGTPAQGARKDPDPEKLGLLVAPARMILEPGQHKLLRIAAIGPASDRERVYRLTVKPEAGRLQSDKSGLKLLVGYDLLVLVRPADPHPHVSAIRSGRSITFSNDGNVSVELADGRQCQSPGKECTPLPGKRLYSGAQWTEPLKADGPVEYSVISPAGRARQLF